MAFRVTKSVSLKVCTNQVEAVITMPRLRNRIWTDKSLHTCLLEIGLDYTLVEVKLMNDELHTRGIVEDIPV